MRTQEEKRLAANEASRKYRARPEVRAEVNKKAKEYKAVIRQTPEGRAKLNAAVTKYTSTDAGRANVNESSKAWCLRNRTSPEGAHKARMRNMTSSYGITEPEFQELMNQQNGCCAICGVDFGSLEKRANVDHCHTTGIVRGLLCGPCNMKLGVLESLAIDYNAFTAYLDVSTT